MIASMSGTTLSCRVCDVAFDDTIAQRRHLKSDSHIHQLRCRVAPPGAVVLPLDATTSSDDEVLQQGRHEPEESSSEEDSSWDEENPDEAGENDGSRTTPDFISNQCLFCGTSSGTFDANVTHMHKTHSFIVPYQKSLSVDLETLVWYLHLVIYSYHECVLCGKRRGSLEAIQQHMLAKGHCRFDLIDEFADFYDLKSLQMEEFKGHRPDEGSVRLQSGKILTHRAHLHSTSSRQASGSSTEQQQQQPLPASKRNETISDLTSRHDRRLGTYAMQLSQLSIHDQQSLAHLTVGEQRSVLATRKRQLDKSQREERRARSKLERLGNKTLMKHFKNDVPGRSNG